MSRPARTGPKRRVRFQAVAWSEVALERSTRGTSSVMKAWRMGTSTAMSRPKPNEAAISSGNDCNPATTMAQMASDRMVAKTCAAIIALRRLTRSARTPPMGPTKSVGT